MFSTPIQLRIQPIMLPVLTTMGRPEAAARSICSSRFAGMRAGSGCVFVHQRADHIGDVFFRTGQPILQRKEVVADVLGGAGNVFQNLRHAAKPLLKPMS